MIIILDLKASKLIGFVSTVHSVRWWKMVVLAPNLLKFEEGEFDELIVLCFSVQCFIQEK